MDFSTRNKTKCTRTAHLCAVLALLLLPIVMVTAATRHNVPRIEPKIPKASRTGGKRVFLDHAEKLYKNDFDSFMVLVGDVQFSKGPMKMRCDSAHYFPDSESFEAYGDVRMRQGDTLFVYADELVYNGPAEEATLYANYGKKVRLINRDVQLKTDVFIYNLQYELGYYDMGGELSDPTNTLTSMYGEYTPSSKEANFYNRVHLKSRRASDTLDIYTDTLYYNTSSNLAELTSPTVVLNARGKIYTTLGAYDTRDGRATLFDRSTVVSKEGPVLTADTIFYDRKNGTGNAFGSISISDSTRKAELLGDYGYYNQVIDSAFVTGRAVMIDYSQGDTLFVHGKYLQSVRRIDSIKVAADTLAKRDAYVLLDTTHIATVFPRVRFFRSDIQGVCDSLRFTQKDSTLRMFFNPVLWNEDRQISGLSIAVHLNDSTVEDAHIPEQAFIAQHIEAEHYNQLSGKELKARFIGGELHELDLNGSVELIMYPEEADSTINKLVNAESSYLFARFKGRATEYLKLWPQTSGQTLPLFLAKKSDYYLPKFKWHADMRPFKRDDIFEVPKYMEEIMQAAGRPELNIALPPLPKLHERPENQNINNN